MANADDETVRTYLASLAKGGFIERENPSTVIGTEAFWRLVKDNGVEAPRLDRQGRPVTHGLGTEQMWRTMQMSGEFDYSSLAALASTPEVPVKPQTAQTYIGHLHKAGYLIQLRGPKVMGRGRPTLPARYRINPAKVSGPRPPMIQRSKAVYDPNLDKVVWEEVKRDDDF
jgi:hypothetical protein